MLAIENLFSWRFFRGVLITAVVAGLALLLAVLISEEARAQANNPPTIVSVVTSDSPSGSNDSFPSGTISLLPASVKSVYVNGVVEDLDGRDDIDSVTSVFYRSGVSGGSSCTSDLTNCYSVAVCSLANNGDPNQKFFSCAMHLSHAADSTVSGGRFPTQEWVAYVSVTDGIDSAQNQSLTKEIGSLLSLTIPGAMNFGTLDMGEQTTAANNLAMSIVQAGNAQADVEVFMTGSLTCTSGSIPRQNIKWSLTDVGFTNQNAQSLTASVVDTDLFVDYGSNAEPSPSQYLYWNISIPTGIGGTCSGITTINTIAH